MKKEENRSKFFSIKFIIITIILIYILIIGSFYIYKKSTLWSEKLSGESKLIQAKYTQEIVLEEANVKLEVSKILANVEIERAKGVATANKIVSGSLKNNSGYLKYLWINNLKDIKGQIIYIPTETNFPVIDAKKIPSSPEPEKESSHPWIDHPWKEIEELRKLMI